MINYKISKVPPPIYDEVRAKFNIKHDFPAGLVFAYYPYIHVYNGRLDPALEAHECTHLQRQENTGPIWWWDKYINDPDFRLKEELMAYRVQYQYILKHSPKRTHFYNLKFFAECLCNPNIYGFTHLNLISAMNMIKETK